MLILRHGRFVNRARCCDHGPSPRRCARAATILAITLPGMSSSYSSSPPPPSPAAASSPSALQPVRIGAGTAVKIGFFGALGATLFSLILSLVIGIVLFILALLGVAIFNIPNLPR